MDSSLNEDPATAILLENEQATIQEEPTKERASEHSAHFLTTAQQQGDDEEEDPMDEGKCSSNPCKLCHNYRHLFVAIAYVCLYVVGICYMPMLPEMKKRYFGSAQKAAGVQSFFDFTSAILGLFTCFIYGKLQDTFGRKPFFIFFGVMQATLVALLLAFQENPLPYMIANVIAKLAPFTFVYAYLSDHFAAEKRSTIFASIIACAGIASLILMTSEFLPHTVVLIIAGSGAGVNILYSIFVVKESLPPTDVVPFSCAMIENPITPIIRFGKSKLMRVSMLTISCVTFAMVGSGEVNNFYLMQRLHFKDPDFAMQQMIGGLLAPIVMLVVLPLLLKFLSDIIVMVMCLIFIMMSLVLLATAWAKWVIFAFVGPLMSLARMATPVFMAIITSTGDPTEQGQRLSALQAVTDLFAALGPLCFGQLYQHVDGEWIALPFAIAGVILIPALFLVFQMQKYREEERQVKRTASIIARSRSNTVATTPPPEGITCGRAEQQHE